MIEIRNITKSYDSLQVLKGIDLDIVPGEVVSIVGPSGAGKTTFTGGLAKALGVKVELSSPSFTISREYAGEKADLIHYDFYRLQDPGLMADDLEENLKNPTNITSTAAKIIVRVSSAFLGFDLLLFFFSFKTENLLL